MVVRAHLFKENGTVKRNYSGLVSKYSLSRQGLYKNMIAHTYIIYIWIRVKGERCLYWLLEALGRFFVGNLLSGDKKSIILFPQSEVCRIKLNLLIKKTYEDEKNACVNDECLCSLDIHFM